MCYNLIINNRKRKMNTRKYPRTMEEAFGPYARGPIISEQDDTPPMQWQDVVVYAAAVLATIFLAAAASLAWI